VLRLVPFGSRVLRLARPQRARTNLDADFQPLGLPVSVTEDVPLGVESRWAVPV
jgi:hypothetical protein